MHVDLALPGGKRGKFQNSSAHPKIKYIVQNLRPDRGGGVITIVSWVARTTYAVGLAELAVFHVGTIVRFQYCMAIILEFSPASWNVIYIPICILILISLSPLEETCKGTVSKSRLIRRGNRGNIFQANSRGDNCNCLSSEMGWICCSLFGGLIAVIYLQGSHMNILPQPYLGISYCVHIHILLRIYTINMHN